MNPEILHKSPVSIVYAGEHKSRNDFPAHSHDQWELIYQRSGHINTRQGDDMIPMHPGMVVIHPPHVEHADFASSPYSIYYVWFKVESRPSWPRICHDDVQHSIGRVCEAVWREWSIRSPDRETMLQLLASELDILLRRSHEDQRRGSADTVVTEVCRIIDEYYRDPPSIRSIAAEVGVSRTRLYEQFVAQSGQTPADYLAQVRLRHALSLLHGSTLTLETIADHCGYHSASHLSRHVKHATGASPGRLRKEIRIS